MYIANYYVRVNGRLLRAGEQLPDNLPQSKLDFLLNVGAIREEPEIVETEEAEVEAEAEAVAKAVPEPVEEPAPVEDAVVEIDSLAGIVAEPKKKKGGKAK